jgi:hypothetical protein
MARIAAIGRKARLIMGLKFLLVSFLTGRKLERVYIV